MEKVMHETAQRLLEAAKIADSSIEKPADLARALNVSEQTINNWSYRGESGVSKAGRLTAQKRLGISATWIEDGTGEMFAGSNYKLRIRHASITGINTGLIENFPTISKHRIGKETSGEHDAASISLALRGHREIPILSLEQASNMAATVDPYALAEGLGTVTTYREISAAAFAIPIQGPSMLPRFEDGDVVIIDPAKPLKPSKFVLAATYAGTVVFRKYREIGANAQGEMIFEVFPLNSDFAILHSERDRLRIIGVMDAHINYDRDE